MKLHDYQEYAVKFIEEHKIAALLLDMGLGKTITTLTAINNLMYDLVMCFSYFKIKKAQPELNLFQCKFSLLIYYLIFQNLKNGDFWIFCRCLCRAFV